MAPKHPIGCHDSPEGRSRGTRWDALENARADKRNLESFVNTNPTIMLYDGWCSLCTRSADKITTLDKGKGKVKAIDLRQSPQLIEAHQLDLVQVRRVLHTITPQGKVLVAMDALRHLMKQVNRGWLISWTALPLLRQLTDRLYILLADNRHRLPSASKCTTGMCRPPSDSD